MSFPYRVGAPVGVRVGTRPAPGVTAEAAGPVWQGGGYWTSDGTGYWTGPTMDAVHPFAHVLRWRRAGTSSHWLMRVLSSPNWERAYVTTGLWHELKGTAGTGGKWVSGTASGDVTAALYTTAFGSIGGGLNTTLAASGTPNDIAADGVFNVGAGDNGGGIIQICAYGLSLWEWAVYKMTDYDLSMASDVVNGGSQADFRTLNPAIPWAYWDFANAYDNGGVATVPDLVLGDGTRDLIGTSVDIATDITTGATF